MTCERRAHLQSGNVITRSRHRSADRVGEIVRKVVREHFAVGVPVDLLARDRVPDGLTVWGLAVVIRYRARPLR